MIYEDSIKTLLSQSLIKQSPVDHKATINLIKRVRADLKTAHRNLPEDQECAFNYAYNAMLRLGLALMFCNGFRPEIKNKHQTIVKYVNAVLGDGYRDLINDYDFMRRKRNRFIYEPDIPCSMKQAEDAIKTAGEFQKQILKIIKEQMPQKEFNFE
ncbi:MAG: hypothetical protein KAR20_29035 [Candidatus Heimdallarchaeota archaeon]|nr:hypothetical protein [Candidatus Heimdallarchaeota archaeon]